MKARMRLASQQQRRCRHGLAGAVPLLFLILALAVARAIPATATPADVRSRDQTDTQKAHHPTRPTVLADDLSASHSFGPFAFIGANDEPTTSVAAAGNFTHFTLPPIDTGALTPQAVPTLVTPGLSLTFTSTHFGECRFVLCVSHLIRPFENLNEWAQGDICELYAEVSDKSPFTTSGMVQSGIKHFAVYSKLAANADSSCAFTLEISGSACAAGFYGSDCSTRPGSTSAQQKPVKGMLLADPTSSALYFEVHPLSVYANALTINATSSRDDFTLFVHEGDLPALAPPAIAPRTDLNLTSQNGQLFATLHAPAYRVATPNQRYFVGITRIGDQADKPRDSEIAVSVTEQTCPFGYHGAQCEFYVPFILEPFDLVTAGRSLIPATAFQWNTRHTEIWSYQALIFLTIRPGFQNFSIGIAAVDGQLCPTLYLRMGAVPTLTEYDMKSTSVDGAQILRFYESGQTLTHDAVWYIGMNVPTFFPSVGNVAMWINTPCPGTTTKLASDGTLTLHECSGNGVCDLTLHQCRCTDRWSGFACTEIDPLPSGISGAVRVLIILGILLGVVLFGIVLAWWLRVGMRRTSPMAHAGYGHHLDQDNAPDP